MAAPAMLRAGKVAGAAKSSFAGASLRAAAVPRAVARRAPAPAPAAELERLRLHNLSPEEGSRHRKARVGRGHSAGQGGSCGLGMRGQKSRTGIRSGFEGGQMPLYRRLPKLRGIAGGMPAGRKTHLTINIGDIAAAVAAGKLDAGAELSLETLKASGLVSGSGKERNLPLKVLADGDVSMPLKVKAAAFSAAAREKLVAAGGSCVDAPQKAKWTRAAAARAAKAAEPAAAKPAAPRKGAPPKKA